MKTVSKHFRKRNAWHARGWHVMYLHECGLGLQWARANVVVVKHGLRYRVVER